MLKINLIILLISFCLTELSFGQTTINGGNVSGKWEKSGSPYIIKGNILIPVNLKLKIDPGVVVKFQGHSKFEVKGILEAIGTHTEFIHFTVEDTLGWSNKYANTGGWGGLIFNQTQSADSSKIVFCKFEYGKAIGSGWEEVNAGGAIFIDGVSKLIVRNSIFTNNWATWYGGAIYCEGANPVFENLLIYNNIAERNGGGICFESHSSAKPTIINSTIVGNKAQYGGGISCDWGCTPTFYNTIIWNNYATEGSQIYLGEENADPDFSNCIIGGGKEAFRGVGALLKYNGLYSNCLDVDPLFVNESQNNYQLKNNSVAINTGTLTNNLKGLDLNGNNRIFGDRIDIGAYESIETPQNRIPLLEKNADVQTKVGTPVNVAISFFDPDISDVHVIAISSDNANVSVEKANDLINPAVYKLTPTANWRGTAKITVVVKDKEGLVSKQNSWSFSLNVSNTIVVGGNILQNTTWNADTMSVTSDITVHDNVLLQIAKGTVVQFQGYYKINVQGTISAIGEKNDSIVFCSKDDASYWGGIRFNGSNSAMNDNDSTNFINCVFTRADAYFNQLGGAIYLAAYSKVLIDGCRISHTKTDYGAITCFSGSNPRIENSKITDTRGGSGIYCNQSNPRIVNNKILYNGKLVKRPNRGGIALEGSSPFIANNLIAFNESNDSGGGIWCYNSSSPQIINNTICYNKAISEYSSGSGISCFSYSSPEITNCIIWENTNGKNYDQIGITYSTCSPKITFSNLPGGFEGTSQGIRPDENPFFKGTFENNIALYPEFTDPLNLDFSLKPISPCIDQGKPDASNVQLPLFDIANNPRITNGRIDIGAIEFQGVFENNRPVIQKTSVLNSLAATTVEMKVIFNDLDKTDTHTISVVSDNPNLQILNLSGNTSNSTYKVVPLNGWTGTANITVKVTDNKGKANSSDTNIYPVTISNSACGIVAGNTVWPKGKIAVSCDITIARDVTLTIQPGTIVEFQNFSKIDVYGKLLALGEKSDSILFTVKDTTGYSYYQQHTGWNGIRFYNNKIDTSVIKYAKFEYGKAVVDYTGIQYGDGNNGGAIYIYNYQNIQILNSAFRYNFANGKGSAIYSELASPLIQQCSFMYNNSASVAVIYVGENTKLLDNLIAYNTSDGYGGGIVCLGSSVVIGNKIFNNANTGLSCNGTPIIQSNIICNNSGTGISFSGCYPLICTNNTIVNNAQSIGISNSSVKIENSIVDGPNATYGYPTFLFCNLNLKNQDNKPMTGTGCFQADPGFVSPSQGVGVTFDALYADWSLLPSSYCINTGNPNYKMVSGELDIAGNPRIFGDFIDIGTFEYQSEPANRKPVISPVEDKQMVQLSEMSFAVKFWDPDLNDTHRIKVTSDNAHIEVQNLSGDTIGSTFNLVSVDAWIGTAQITIEVTDNSESKDSTAVSTYNVTVLDEVCGNITNNSVWSGTVKISCMVTVDDNVTLKILPGTKIEFAEEASLEVVGTLIAEGTASDSITFSASIKEAGWKGISFRNGFYAYWHPSGVMNDNDTTRFAFCKFSHCTTFALFIDGYSKVIVSNSRFSNNKMSCIKTYEASPAILNNTFENNKTNTYQGGTLWIERFSNPIITGNVIRYNEAAFGGGINCDYQSHPEIINNLIHGNKATQGGAIYCTQSNPKLYNNTIVNNSAGTGGGICCNYSKPDLINSIVWNNKATEQGSQIYHNDYAPSVKNCLIQTDNSYKVGFSENLKMIFSLPPNFTDEANGDYSLSGNSPCINTGTNQIVNESFPEKDLFGNIRVSDSIIDMGAIEFIDIPENIAPVSVRLSYNSVYENRPSGTVVGILKAIDPNYNDLHVFSLANDAGGIYNNDVFEISGDTLKTKSSFDYESVTNQIINVLVTDNGGKTHEQNIEINIQNINEPPVILQQIPDMYIGANSLFSYTIPENTFFKDKGESLYYLANLENNVKLPDWLKFNSWEALFFGNPFEYGEYPIVLKASDYHFTQTDTFVINVVKEVIELNSELEFESKENLANVFLPDSIIQYVGQGEHLIFDVFMQNGEPLPKGLTFNPEDFSFTIDSNSFPKIKSTNPILIDVIIAVSTVSGEKTVIYLTLKYDITTSSVVRTNNAETDAIIYPNPNSGKFKLKLNGFNSGKYLVKVFTNEGREIYSNFLSVVNNTETHEFNLEPIHTGMYLLIISSGDTRVVSKLIIK